MPKRIELGAHGYMDFNTACENKNIVCISL